MPPYVVPTLDFRHFFILAPEIVLGVWGLVVLLADVGWLRGRSGAERRRIVGWLALAGTFAGLVAAILPILARSGAFPGYSLDFAGINAGREPDPVVFFGTLAADAFTEWFNLLFVLLLALVLRTSMAWSFTEEWGEYFALLFWSTVGMMLLTSSEELLTLFLTLETMTICLYLCTAFEKGKRRSAEGALKYFVYGSVSSALFLFGLSMVYGLTGTTRLDAIRQILEPVGPNTGLTANVAGSMALLLMLVGFGFKIAAVPFHQWAPDAYEGAPAPVAAWIATGSKVASLVALMKVLLHGLGPWSGHSLESASPGWIGVVVVLSAASMTFGNFAALAQRNLKRMLAYSSIAHAGYMLVGVAAAGVSTRHQESAGSVLFYLVVYAFSNIGAFAVAAWLVRDKGTDDIDDLNGLGLQYPALATCIVVLMLSLIGMPPFAGFFGKLYMFMEVLNDKSSPGRLPLTWLVALGLLNSVVSAFYYVRVLKAMFLRKADLRKGTMKPATSAIAWPIAIGTLVVVFFGIYPRDLVDTMRSAAVPMLSSGGSLGSEYNDPARLDRSYIPSRASSSVEAGEPAPARTYSTPAIPPGRTRPRPRPTAPAAKPLELPEGDAIFSAPKR